MAANAPKSFTALIEQDSIRLRWAIARVPFDLAQVWPTRRGRRVRVHIAGAVFRSSLFTLPGEGPVVLINKAMQAAACATIGSRIEIALEPDLEERPVEIPLELTKALKGDRRLPKWFDALNYSARKEIGAWVSQPKSAEGRIKRAEQMAERLLQTLEGEIDLPPILEAAFQRQPLARQGWEAMTPLQRRGHLMGIFNYLSVESRERRAAKTVEEAVSIARKRLMG